MIKRFRMFGLKIMFLSKFHFAIKYMKRKLETKMKRLIQLKEHVKISCKVKSKQVKYIITGI